MLTRCFNPCVRWCVLLSYLLVVGAASAAPWFSDAAWGPICRGAAGSGPFTGGLGTLTPEARGLDCALCLPLHAPPSLQVSLGTDAAPHGQALMRFHTPFFGPHPQTLPPVRGPPLA